MSRKARDAPADPGLEPDQMSNFHIKADFVRVKSYENDSSTGQVVISGIDDLSTIKDMASLLVKHCPHTNAIAAFLVTTEPAGC